MLFVDGENLAIRGREFAASHGLSLDDGAFYSRDVFLWLPTVAHACQFAVDETYQSRGLRAHYYTSVVGDDDRINVVKRALWDLGFEPNVFKRIQGQQRSKGVDISLAVDVLRHAYRGDYDIALLVAGDGDYVPLVQEVKRLGKIVDVAFFGTVVHPALLIASDTFRALDKTFVAAWSPKPGGAADAGSGKGD